MPLPAEQNFEVYTGSDFDHDDFYFQIMNKDNETIYPSTVIVKMVIEKSNGDALLLLTNQQDGGLETDNEGNIWPVIKAATTEEWKPGEYKLWIKVLDTEDEELYTDYIMTGTFTVLKGSGSI